MQMIMFKMSDEYYLISAKSVEEIIDTVPITYVPLAPGQGVDQPSRQRDDRNRIIRADRDSFS